MLYTSSGFIKMLFQHGVICLEFLGILDVIQILTKCSQLFCMCISVICLIGEYAEVWFVGGCRIVIVYAKILRWEL
jgi:hypothetical protein